MFCTVRLRASQRNKLSLRHHHSSKTLNSDRSRPRGGRVQAVCQAIFQLTEREGAQSGEKVDKNEYHYTNPDDVIATGH